MISDVYLITYTFKQQYSFFGALCEYVGNYNKFIIIVYWNFPIFVKVITVTTANRKFIKYKLM